MSLLVDDEDEQLHKEFTSKEQEKILPLIAADLDRNKEIASDCFWSDHEIIVSMTELQFTFRRIALQTS